MCLHPVYSKGISVLYVAEFVLSTRFVWMQVNFVRKSAEILIISKIYNNFLINFHKIC